MRSKARFLASDCGLKVFLAIEDEGVGAQVSSRMRRPGEVARCPLAENPGLGTTGQVILYSLEKLIEENQTRSHYRRRA
jgi:hypothetical protein